MTPSGRTAVSIVAPQLFAALVAGATGFLLLLAIGFFGVAKGAVTAFALPMLIASFTITDKARKLFYLIIFLLPLAAADLPPRRYGISICDVSIFLLALIVFLDESLGESKALRWEKTIFTVPMICLLAASLLSAILSQDMTIAMVEIISNIKYVIFYILFMHFVRTREDLNLVVILILLGFVPSALLGLAQHFLHIGLELNPDALQNTHFKTEGINDVRIFGPFSESITFAQYLVVPTGLLAGLVLYPRRFVLTVLWAMGFGLGALAILLTLSRGGWTAFAIAMITVLWIWVPKKAVPYLLFWPLALAVPIVGYWGLVSMYIPAGVAARMAFAGHDFDNGRGILWVAAIRIFRDHPWVGVGLRNLLHVLPLYDPLQLWDVFYKHTLGLSAEGASEVGHVHVDNFYLTLLAEVGIVGMIPFAVVLLRALHRGYRNFLDAPGDLKPYALGVFGAMVGTFACMTTVHGYSDPRIALLLWMLLAMTVVLQRLVGRRSSADPAAIAAPTELVVRASVDANPRSTL